SHGLSYLTRSPSPLTSLDPLARQLLARDRFGNPRLEGGDSFHVRIEGPSIPHERRLLDLGTGEYELYLLLPVSGEYRVHVSLDGSPLRGSPTTVEVVRGDGVLQAIAGEMARLQLVARESQGTTRRWRVEESSRALSVVLRPSRPEHTIPPKAQQLVEIEVDPQGENCLSVLFPVCLAGEWLVDVALHSSPLRGSPCTLLVTPAPPHAASTTAQGSGLLSATPGSESAFVITVQHNPLPAPPSRLQLIAVACTKLRLAMRTATAALRGVQTCLLLSRRHRKPEQPVPRAQPFARLSIAKMV
ncbi:MAG: hypothetical protein SGPRY_012122, partial [Prymnesium sp.]